MIPGDLLLGGLPMITDVIFDLDDTLCDFTSARMRGLAHAFALLPSECRYAAADLWRSTEPALYRAFAAREISREDYRTRRFQSVLTALEISAGDSLEEVRLIRDMNDAYMHEGNDAIEEIPGARECLASLRGGGLKCHLLTNGPADGQRRKIARLGFEPLFDHVFIGEEIGSFKPDAAAFAHVIDRIGVPKDRIVMIGDNLAHDIWPARESGLMAIHFAPDGTGYVPHIRNLSEVAAAVAIL